MLLERQKKWSFRNLIALEALAVVRDVKPIMIALMKKVAAIMDLECSVPISKLQATAQVGFFHICRICQLLEYLMSPDGLMDIC